MRSTARTRKRGSGNSSVSIDLSVAELDLLIALSDYYQKSMGAMRHVVRLTGSSETRQRFRFLAEESRWLRRCAEAERSLTTGEADEVRRVAFTPRTAVAFWGRLLASLHSPRSRRRLRAEEIERREALAATLRDALRRFARSRPAALAAEIDTRRPVEQDLMREALALTGE